MICHQIKLTFKWKCTTFIMVLLYIYDYLSHSLYGENKDLKWCIASFLFISPYKLFVLILDLEKANQHIMPYLFMGYTDNLSVGMISTGLGHYKKCNCPSYN